MSIEVMGIYAVLPLIKDVHDYVEARKILVMLEAEASLMQKSLNFQEIGETQEAKDHWTAAETIGLEAAERSEVLINKVSEQEARANVPWEAVYGPAVGEAYTDFWAIGESDQPEAEQDAVRQEAREIIMELGYPDPEPLIYDNDGGPLIVWPTGFDYDAWLEDYLKDFQ